MRILICAILLIGACNGDRPSADTIQLQKKDTVNAVAADQTDIEVKTFTIDSAGYGYDILMNGRLYIHQPHIPALPGNVSFKTEADARKTGELVAFKIRNNIMPPSITVEELDSLGIR